LQGAKYLAGIISEAEKLKAEKLKNANAGQAAAWCDSRYLVRLLWTHAPL
jgi:hypothetical protein